ncbi:cysteine-rich motor neuron 1 protein-like [Pollicipes pollicipes]|uniref:cysteine-rich motor neuron 1 protein-like n=1 Tax=Pollicipes pollicipes TaxID=41117 RepID=UPI001885493B|nr:cysteine-rich motor neuron 1 protein-like [Pollicipes pollicipes]
MSPLGRVLVPLALSLLALSDGAAAGRRLQRSPEAPAQVPPTCQLSRISYNSGEMIERKNPCDFCFCYKGEVLCWKKQCPPPPQKGDKCSPKYVERECCPRYMCEGMGERFNLI